MRRVVIESPYSAATPWGVQRHVKYLRACLRDALDREEAPFASHGLYTQEGVLDDTKEEERVRAMEAGFAWMLPGAADVVYCDLGLSGGMLAGITRARRNGLVVEFRELGPAWIRIDPITHDDVPRNVFALESAAQLGRMRALWEERARMAVR
jgi:hypothetical protein